MLNTKGSAAAMTQHAPHTFSTSDAGPDFTNMPDHPEFSTRPPRLMQTLPYAPSPSHQSTQGELQQPVQMLASSTDAQRPGFENGYTHSPTRPEDQQQPSQPLSSVASGAGEVVKSFACANCGKGFARRSDLARHGKLISHSLCSV